MLDFKNKISRIIRFIDDNEISDAPVIQICVNKSGGLNYLQHLDKADLLWSELSNGNVKLSVSRMLCSHTYIFTVTLAKVSVNVESKDVPVTPVWFKSATSDFWVSSAKKYAERVRDDTKNNQ